MGKVLVREKRDVEQLVVWALVDNGLGSIFTDRGTILDWTDYGMRVSSDRWSVPAPNVQHDDAHRIAGAISRLPPDPETGAAVMAELVVRHGRTNSRPDWCEEGVGRMVPKLNKRGQVEFNYERPGDRKSRKLGKKMIWEGETQARVDWYRAKYDVWWIALVSLAEPLNGLLTKFEATGPRAPEKPWEGARVFGPDGKQVMGMHGGASAARLAALERRGPVELAPETANIHSSGSAIR